FVTTEITVFIDADGSHDPADIPKLIAPILKVEADHVSASRLIGGSSELHGGFDEFFRLMGSSLITALINWRFKVKLSESQNGFRAIKTDVMKQLGLQENITTIEQEMIMRTLKRGFRMAEVPSHEHTRKMGYSKISVKKVAFRYVYTLIKYLFF
ncbi:MAG: glycosyltransferase family 2 protein, partial [Proteobacteria bacterium]|nr:glycosyltransferase family 2 protein [Pseudomonadota bacterium]